MSLLKKTGSFSFNRFLKGWIKWNAEKQKICRCAIVLMSRAAARAFVVSAWLITGKWESFRPAIFPMILSAPMTGASDVLFSFIHDWLYLLTRISQIIVTKRSKWLYMQGMRTKTNESVFDIR